MKLYYAHAVPQHENLTLLAALVLATGGGVGGYALWREHSKGMAAALALASILVAATWTYIAMLTVGAEHGAFS
jgi:hypothetical protein